MSRVLRAVHCLSSVVVACALLAPQRISAQRAPKRVAATDHATIALPPDATLELLSGVNGVRVTVGPHLTMTLRMLPPRATALKPLLDSLVAAGNAKADSLAQVAPPLPARLAGRPAWRIIPFCGDCEAGVIYVALTDGTFMVEWTVDGEQRVEWARGRSVVRDLLASLRFRP